jgi:hypothetical protein
MRGMVDATTASFSPHLSPGVSRPSYRAPTMSLLPRGNELLLSNRFDVAPETHSAARGHTATLQDNITHDISIS